MSRPDPTPPDASLFPIAPTFTADLDAKALDDITTILRMWLGLTGSPSVHSSECLKLIAEKVATTGRKPS